MGMGLVVGICRRMRIRVRPIFSGKDCRRLKVEAPESCEVQPAAVSSQPATPQRQATFEQIALTPVRMSQVIQMKKDVVAAFSYSGRPFGDFDHLRPLFKKLGADGIGNRLLFNLKTFFLPESQKKKGF